MTSRITTRAVTTGPGIIELESKTSGPLRSGECLVRVERVGICGSDMHIFSGHHPTATFPRVQGHEVSAVIEALPQAYAGPLEPGLRVAIDPLLSCGRCYACRLGRSNCCPAIQVIGAHVDGFLQEYIAVPVENAYPCPQLTPDEAVLTEPLSVGLHAVRRAGVSAAEQIVIIGAGPIGLCSAVAAMNAGGRVLMVDTLQPRLDLASAIGVEQIARSGFDDIDAVVADWTNGEGPPVVIDAVGTPGVIQQCCKLVAPAGRVVIVGLSDQQVSLPISDFTYKEMTILGSRASARLFAESIALVERNRAAISRLITHRFPLSETQAALEFAIANPRAASKVIVEV
ncbi:MAG: alcohol dehydrogenase catalytic domain-containing protein [Thermomicrobiales bacterium]